MGLPASQSKGPRYSFHPQNLRAVAARFITMCKDYTDHFRVANHSVAGEARIYLSGLLMKAPRKNMERIEECVAGCNYESTQHFISESPWSHREVLDHIARDVDTAIGGEDSDLVIDESGFTKKGDKSVGVARQYNGRLGKVDNCQVGVYGALTDGQRVSLIDTRLYLPKEWTDEPARCRGAGIPEEEQVFKTKPELGLAIVDNAMSNNIRFGCVSFDGFYGNVPEFMEGLWSRGVKFIGAVHKNQIVYESDPRPYLPRRKAGRGRKHTLYRARTEGCRVDEFNEYLSTQISPWRLVTIREGTKGFVGVHARRKRVWIWNEGSAEAREVWLVITKDPFCGELRYFLSNFDKKVALKTLAARAARRFFVERAFQDAKTSVGMADYQVRVWKGWNHHMAMVAFAMLFLLKERILNQEDMTLLSCQDIVELLNYYLPRADTTEEAVFKQLEKRHRKRIAAIRSEYKRQRERYPDLNLNVTK